jgi:chromosome partitioning protein
VSNVQDGIARLDLLPSSIRLIEIQDEIPFIAMKGNYTRNPQEILRVALQSTIDRYDFVIIDCPPSLGTVTKNGLRISTGYVIPTIPDIVSTWGIYQIIQNVMQFARDVDRPIPPLGIVATKVQVNNLQKRVIDELVNRRLGRFAKRDGIEQPPLFNSLIPQAVDVARGSDETNNPSTLRLKYGSAYNALHGLTEEILQRCQTKPV